MFSDSDLSTASVCCKSAGELPFLGGEEGLATQRSSTHEMGAEAIGIAAQDVWELSDAISTADGAEGVAGDVLLTDEMTVFDAPLYLK